MAKDHDGFSVDGPITRRLKATRGDDGWWPPRDGDKTPKDTKHEGWHVTGRGKKGG
jgi:hypothetical protein